MFNERSGFVFCGPRSAAGRNSYALLLRLSADAVRRVNLFRADARSHVKIEDAKPVLAENAEVLVMNPEVDVEVVGYCNSYEGEQGYNLGLKRAESVRSFLAEQGVNYNRVRLGVDCGGIRDEGNPLPGPAEVKAALDSRVSIKANPRPEPGVL